MRIHHFTDSKTGRMKVRYLHFILENASGTDPFSFREIPLAVSAEKSHKPAQELAHLIHSKSEPFTDNIRLFKILASLYKLTAPARKKRSSAGISGKTL